MPPQIPKHGFVYVTLSVKRCGDIFDLVYNDLGVPKDLGFDAGVSERGFPVLKIRGPDIGTPLPEPKKVADSIRGTYHPLVSSVKIQFD